MPAPACSITRADWLALARALPARSVDLLYADPPFNTGSPKSSRRGARPASFADRWPSTEAYIAWLEARVRATVPALKASANVLIHCDWRTSHHVRLMLDRVLGEDCFANHLIWSYGLGGSSPRHFARKHDDILFYRVDPARAFFHAPRVPASSRRLAGQTKKATDVLAIPSLNNMASERVGYPTQKPLALLELLVGACCPPGGVVLDPCCGSGTTLLAALRTGRSPIGGDISPRAVAVARRRCAGAVPKAALPRSQ